MARTSLVHFAMLFAPTSAVTSSNGSSPALLPTGLRFELLSLPVLRLRSTTTCWVTPRHLSSNWVTIRTGARSFGPATLESTALTSQAQGKEGRSRQFLTLPCTCSIAAPLRYCRNRSPLLPTGSCSWAISRVGWARCMLAGQWRVHRSSRLPIQMRDWALGPTHTVSLPH